MACSGRAGGCGGGGAEEFADLGPGEFLVAGVMDGPGQELLGLGDEAGQRVQADCGAAEPAGGAQPGEVIDRLAEDVEAVVAGGWGGQLAGAGQASSEANSCSRWSWWRAMASSCWACRVGRKAMLVWKKVQVSQIDSNAQSGSGGRVHQPLPSIRWCSRRSRAIFGPIASAGSAGAWP
jgi:hypothetical protein